MLIQYELEQIEKLIADNSFPDQFECEIEPAMLGGKPHDWLLWNQLSALWTALCIHFSLEPDTNDYDHRVMYIWNQIGCEGDFDDFDLFMSRFLC